MGSSGQAEVDGAGRSGAAANAYCRRRVVVHARVAWCRQGSADTGKAGIGVGIDIEVARQIRAFRFDINVRRVIRRDCRSIIPPRSTGFSRTPLLAVAQRDEVVNDGDLPIQVSIVFGG